MSYLQQEPERKAKAMNDTNETKTDGCTTQGANVVPEGSQTPCVTCGEPARIAVTSECLSCYAHATFHGGDCETIDDVEEFIGEVLEDPREGRGPANGTGCKLSWAEKREVAEIGRSYGFTFSDQWK